MSNESDLPRKEPTRWDKRYAGEDPEKWKRPSRLLADNIHLFGGGVDSEGGRKRALDVACGPGRNSVFLVEHGFVVDAVDNSRTGIDMARAFAEERGEGVVENLNLIEADLTDFTIAPDRYDLIVNFYYLERGLIPKMAAGLKGGGYLVFETFTKEHTGFGTNSDPAHYLDTNELIRLALDVTGEKKFRVLYYREGSTFEEGLMRSAAQLIARRV